MDTPRMGKWLVDSGVSSHMTLEKELLSDYREFKKPEKVALGDGRMVEAMGVGNVRVIMVFKVSEPKWSVLHRVSYVPKLACNLFSVRATASKGNVVKFGRSRCWIRRSDGKLLGMDSQTASFTNSIVIDGIYIHSVGAEKRRGSVASAVGSLEWTEAPGDRPERASDRHQTSNNSETIVLRRVRWGQDAPETIQASGRNPIDQEAAIGAQRCVWSNTHRIDWRTKVFRDVHRWLLTVLCCLFPEAQVWSAGEFHKEFEAKTTNESGQRIGTLQSVVSTFRENSRPTWSQKGYIMN